jgi:enamine deaminase RidA (YjgF/YER057c/UK114 family)
VSFDVFLQRFGDHPGDAHAGLRVLEPLLVSPPGDGFGLVRTTDGEGEVYGLGTDSLMFTHASGLIRAPRLTDRAPYAYAAVASDVRRLGFTAGACPLDEEGETEAVAVGDVAGQAEQVMANLRTAFGGGWCRPRRCGQDDGLRRKPQQGRPRDRVGCGESSPSPIRTLGTSATRTR